MKEKYNVGEKVAFRTIHGGGGSLYSLASGAGKSLSVGETTQESQYKESNTHASCIIRFIPTLGRCNIGGPATASVPCSYVDICLRNKSIPVVRDPSRTTSAQTRAPYDNDQ